MTIQYSAGFDQQFARLPKTLKRKATDCIELFLDDPKHEALRRHALGEEWAGYYSISADEDLRLHFKLLDDDTAFFVAVGTHSQLYK